MLIINASELFIRSEITDKKCIQNYSRVAYIENDSPNMRWFEEDPVDSFTKF